MHTHAKKQLPTTLAVSFAYLLTVSIFYPTEQAFAQSPIEYVSGFGLDILDVGYSNGKIWALANNGTQGTTGNNWIYEVDPTDNTIDALYNITRSKGALAWHLWCSPIYCYTFDESTTASAVYQIATITAGSETKGTITLSSATFAQVSESVPIITGRFLTSGSVTQLFVSYKQGSNTTWCFAQYDGLSLTLSQSLCDVNASYNGRNPIDIGFFAPNATDWHAFASIQGSGTGFMFVWNLFTNTEACSAVTVLNQFPSYHGTSTNPLLGYPPEQPTADAGLFAWNSASAAPTDQIFFSEVDCVSDSDYTITTTDTGLATVALRTALFSEDPSGSGSTDPDVGLAFFQETGANARISVTSWNGLTFATSGTPVIYDTNPSASQSASQGKFVIMPTLEKIMVPETGAGRRIVILDYSSLIVPSGGGGQVAPTFPENNVAELVGLTFCLGGFIPSADCNATTGLPNDTDPTTNGTGVALLIFLIIISYAFIVAIHYQAQRTLAKQNVQLVEVMNIHPIILVVMVFADFAITWYFGYISDIVFYTFIVIVIGLAGFGIYRQVKPSV